MGFFLSSIQNEMTIFESKIKKWSEPLQKIREYHGVFKTVCDTFVIKKQQFPQIFGNDDKLELWQGSATINALEVFCGLGFYSSGTGFRLKLKFLFALFDFNEIKSISVVDLEYMILSILNFTYRILGRANSRADQLRLAEWLMRFVNPHKRININSLARFCHQSEEARSFLRISNNLQGQINQIPNQIYDQEKDMDESERLTLQSERKQIEINTKLAWFGNFCQKLTKPKYKKEIVSNCSLSWVYGMQLHRFRTPFLVLSDGRILYAISSKAIIYCSNAKSQSIYAKHSKNIECFAVYEPDFIVASSEGQTSPKIHIWDYRSLETHHIINIDHSHHIHLLAFSASGILTTVGFRQNSPVVLFDSRDKFSLRTSFSVDESIFMLVPFFSPLELQSLPESLISIFVLGSKKSIIVIDEKYKQYIVKFDTNITSMTTSYMSIEQPYRRYFTGQSLRLFIVTAHENGVIAITIFDPSSEIFEEEKLQFFKLQEPAKRILFTAQSFIVITRNEVRVYDLGIFTLHEDKAIDVDHCRIIRSSDTEHLRLLSKEFFFAAINNRNIFLVTEEGDFLQIGDRQISFSGSLHQQQSIQRLDEFVKLGGKLKAMCFAQREEKGSILVVSQNKKIFEIDPQNHKVFLMLEIGYNDVITAIDYAISEQGPAYMVCGSLSGRLLVRVDEEEVIKVYDCQCEVTDLKISRDASYLLIATLNSVMFFQLTPSFSSPRKITFENESPVSLNFLDNPRYCSVGTSAKNVYLIEVPQLRHRNVQKDNQSFSVTKMTVDFPHRPQNSSPKITYSRCFVGGDMKFYLLSLTTGQLLYFPSMSSLQHKNYLMLPAHQCPIANIVLSQDQSLFYTIGQSDSMLLQWSVRQQRSQFVGKHSTEARDHAEQIDLRQMQIFSRMKLVSQVSKTTEDNTEYGTFFFRGTKSDKLNKKLHDSLKINTQTFGEEELALMKRHCRAYLKTNAVYGLQQNKCGQVRYRSSKTQDSRFLYTISRFLIQTDGEGGQSDKIHETTTQIAYFSLNELGEPVYAEFGQCPRIFVSGVQAVRTLHKNGLIHFTLFGDFVLSFGLEQDYYSINLHNYRTRQLIAERTTYHSINQFLMLSPQHFVSLHQVRIWHGLIASEAVGIASSGAVLPNRKDICLGGMQGELSVLSTNGLFEMASNAHSKEIIAIQVNQLPTSFEIITASLDESVKIWNEYFQALLTINLTVPGQFKTLRELDSIGVSDANPRTQAFVVRSLDCKNHKILLAMSLGQIWEYTISSRQEKVHGNADLNSSGNMSSGSSEEINDDLTVRSQRVQLNYYVQRKRLLNAHCSYSVPLLQRFVAFDVHLEFPLFVSAGSDGKLTFRDYLREEVVANYVCERDESVKVRAVRFSTKGRMIVVGLSTGIIMTFYMDLTFNNFKGVSQVVLRHFQTFKLDDGSVHQVIAMEFNDTSQMFAVSYAINPASNRQRSPDIRQNIAFIKIFRIKSEKNHNTDEAFYEFKELIRLREEESTGKAFRFAVRLQFDSQQGKNFLFLAEEYFDSQGGRLFTTRGRHSVYCFQDKCFLSDEYSISWERFSYPALINSRNHDSKTDETQDNYTITAMLRWRDVLIYGGYDGKLHLLRLESLDTYEDVSQYRLSDMCLSRVYSVLTSPITELRVGGNQERLFLFVGGYGDECVVKLELIEEDPAYFLQHQPYPFQNQDPHQEFMGKEHFYLTINNRQPLREELSNILQDVESQNSNGLKLQFLKAFGRRAFDRRYNLTYFDENILYCLGPNLVVQSLSSSRQFLLKADPSPFSHCPQISAFHFNSHFLIVATQEERSKIYIWDIKSKSCISSMQLECSFVLIIRFLGDDCAVYYGINDKYEPIVGLVDWRNGRILGTMRLAFSGLSTVRDLAAISTRGDLSNGRKQFVTCGFLHLCQWQMRGTSLVYHNFNSQSVGRYLCVKELNGYIITGCQEGHLYLWHEQELIHILHNAHLAAVRCLQVDLSNELFISGGMDGLILFLKVQENKLSPFNRVQLKKIQSNRSLDEEQIIQSYKIEYEVQSLAPNPTFDHEEYQKLLVGTRSGNIIEVKYTDSTDSTTLICQHHDNQTVVSATFSAFDKQSFFTLTNAGLIERFSLHTLSRTFRFDLGQRALKIQACDQLLLVCCRQQVIAYRILGEQGILERSDSFYIDAKKLDEEEKDVEITRFYLSKSEKLIALCLKNCGKEPIYQISIFNLSGELLHQLGNLKHQVDYLDFSTDDKYLLFKDRYEEIGMISLDKDYRKINTIFVEMGIEWQQEALRLSPSAQSIYYSYSCENKITALARLGPDKLIVGDQMGTVRIFDYPCPDDKLGELHLHCYCVHMNDIAEIVVHPQLTHVISIGLQDRSLVLWRVVLP